MSFMTTGKNDMREQKKNLPMSTNTKKIRTFEINCHLAGRLEIPVVGLYSLAAFMPGIVRSSPLAIGKPPVVM